MSIGKSIKKALAERHMTQGELAQKINLTESCISRYVNDQRTPKADTLARVADALNVTTDSLLEHKDTAAYDIEALLADPTAHMSYTQIKRLVRTLSSSSNPDQKKELINILSA